MSRIDRGIFRIKSCEKVYNYFVVLKEPHPITKLEKFFSERGLMGFEQHVKFLRVLQDLRSKSAAHRKGSSYDKLVADLQITDEGQQRVFAVILSSACGFIRHLYASLLPKGDD